MAETRVRGRVVTPTGIVDEGVVVVADGVVRYVGCADSTPAGPTPRSTVDAPPDGYVLPGLVDVHDHGGAGRPSPEAIQPRWHARLFTTEGTARRRSWRAS